MKLQKTLHTGEKKTKLGNTLVTSDRTKGVQSVVYSYGCPSVPKYVEVITSMTLYVPYTERVSLPGSDIRGYNSLSLTDPACMV